MKWKHRLKSPFSLLGLNSPVPNGHGDLFSKCLLEHLVCLIRAPARTVVPIDLQYLVPKSQTNQGGWGICLD